MNTEKEQDEIAAMSLQQLSSAYLAGSLSPVEVTRHLLARTKRVNEKINAVYYFSEELALSQAKASETRYRKGQSRGLLDGVPTTIKDALPIKGMPTYRGAASTDSDGIYYDWNAPAVDRLLDAGAVILGKNTMCDFGIIASGISSKHGITRNPWDLSRTPGASSSGAAASIAAGLMPAALGTDIVGSIRLPASYCGLVGMKPSYGRVPYYFPNSPALVAGPLARTVNDAAAMMDIICRPDTRDFTCLPYKQLDMLANVERVPLKPRIRVITSLGFGVPPDTQVVNALMRAAARFEANGAIVESPSTPVFSPHDLAMAERFYRARTYAELAQAPVARQPLAAQMFAWTAEAKYDSGVDITQSLQCLQRLREEAIGLIAKYDFLILPSTPTTAFPAESYAPKGYSLFDAWCNTFLFNLTEQPALSINCGFSDEGMPIGLQIVGQRFDDLGVLQLGRLFESLTNERPGIAPI